MISQPSQFLTRAARSGTPVLWITDRCGALRVPVQAAGGAVQCIPALRPFPPREEIVDGAGNLDPALAEICLEAVALFPDPTFSSWTHALLQDYYRGAFNGHLPLDRCAADLPEDFWVPPVAGICLCRVPEHYRASTFIRLVATLRAEFQRVEQSQIFVIEDVAPDARCALRHLTASALHAPVTTFFLPSPPPREERLASALASVLTPSCPTPTPL